MDTQELFELIKTKAGLRPATKASAKHLECGLTPDKQARFQVLVHPEYLEVGLVFDDANARTNQRIAESFSRQLEPELAAGEIRSRRGGNVYLTERLAINSDEALDALAHRVAQRLGLWKARFDDRGEEISRFD